MNQMRTTEAGRVTLLACVLTSGLCGCGRDERPSGTDSVDATGVEAVATCLAKDPDIGQTYHGECVNSLPHGKGKASGRDVYEGGFAIGEPHGQGVYLWGPGSQWNDHRYEGAFYKGTRSGFGVYTSPKRDEAGNVVEGIDTQSGVFFGGKLVEKCATRTECAQRLRLSSLDVNSIPDERVVTIKFVYQTVHDGMKPLDDEFPGVSTCIATEVFTESGLTQATVVTKPQLVKLLNLFKDFDRFTGVVGYCRGQGEAGVTYADLAEDPYQELDAGQLLVDLPNMMPGDKVKIRGEGISAMPGMLMVHVRGANMLQVDTSKLPREQKLALMQRCTSIGSDCTLVIEGHVGLVGLIVPGLVAEDVQISGG